MKTLLAEKAAVPGQKNVSGTCLNSAALAAPDQDPKPDIQYEMASDTFLAIHRKELSGLKAYQQKKVKLKAFMPDIIKLQKIDRL